MVSNCQPSFVRGGTTFLGWLGVWGLSFYGAAWGLEQTWGSFKQIYMVLVYTGGLLMTIYCYLVCS